MNPQDTVPDNFAPIGIVVVPAIVGGLVWLCCLICQAGF